MREENSNFIIELAKIMSVDGKVNIKKYSAILDLVSKYFNQKLGQNYVEPTKEDNELVEVVWGEPLRKERLPWEDGYNPTDEHLEELRKSYNKGFLDSKKEQIIEFIKWFGKQDLKRYPEGWCELGGSNGFHFSDEALCELFWAAQ